MSGSVGWRLLKDTFSEWSQDNASRLAAALAYYTIFSVAPLLVVVISIIGMVVGRDTAQEEVSRQMEGLMGKQGADVIASMVKSAGQTGSGWAMVIGIALLLYGATNVFASLQDALNTVWEVKPRPGLGFWQTLKNRLTSFAMVLAIAFVLMVSMVISAVVAWMTERFGGATVFWQGVEILVSLGIFTLIFAAIFKILPDVKIQWRSVWTGAAITAVLFALGKFLIGLYLGRIGSGGIYHAAGSLLIVLLWVYYAAQILFFGAEFTQVYSKYRGLRIKPVEHAVDLTETDRVRQGIPHEETVAAAVDRADRGRDIRVVPRGLAARAYLAGAAGLAAGFAAGAVGYLLKNRDNAVRQAAAHATRERIRQIHRRLVEGERIAEHLRETSAADRLDLLERRVRRISQQV